MNNSDNLLRKKEQEIMLDSSNKEKHWEQLLIAINEPAPVENIQKPSGKVFKLVKYFMSFIAVSAISFLIVKGFKNKKHNKGNETSTSKVNPPMPNLNVPFESFSINPSFGDTLITKNGSIIIFPKNAIVDENGLVVTNTVEIKTREFNDPIDFAFSGIPMTYDSAGKVYDFLSSGMIEINAYQNNKKLFVNPNAKPEILLTSTSIDKNSNLYQLDEATGKWDYKGKDEVIINNDNLDSKDLSIQKPIAQIKATDTTTKKELHTEKNIALESETKFEEMPMPIPPKKATGKNPIIVIQIDPDSFKELKLYDNLQFEIIGGDKWNEADSKIEWNDVNLERITGGELYKITFTKAARKISYLANPVFEGYDYDHALSKYEVLLEEYNRSKANNDDKVMLSQKQAGSYKKVELQKDTLPNKNFKLIEYNPEAFQELFKLRSTLITRDYKLNEQKNRIYLDSIINVNNNQTERIKKENENRKKLRDSIDDLFSPKMDLNQLQENMVRRFTIDGFGIWNCDTPFENNSLNINVNYVNNDNKYFEIPICYSIAKSRNALIQCFNNNVLFLAKNKNLIFGINRGKIYYHTISNSDDLKKGNNERLDMPMIELITIATSYYQVKKLLIEKLNKS
jgi:hypothetical protein